MTDADFWLAVRQAALSFVDAIEVYKLAGRIQLTTAEMRKWLRSYRLAYPFQPIAAEEVQEHIEVLTTEPECGKL